MARPHSKALAAMRRTISPRPRAILTVSAVIAALVGLIILAQPRQYVATAEFLLQEPSSAPSQGLAQLASQFGVMNASGGPSAAFYAEWIPSFEIMRDVASSRYTVDGRSTTLYDYFRIAPGTTAGDQKMVATMRKHVRARADRVLSVVHVEVQLKTPALASQVGRRIIDVLNEYATSRRRSIGRAEREFVARQLADARDSLKLAETALLDFSSSNRHLETSPVLQLESARLQRRVAEAQLVVQTLLQSYEAAKIQEVRDTPVLSVTQRPEVSVEPVPRGTMLKVVIVFCLAAALQWVAAQSLLVAQRDRPTGSSELPSSA